jgi:hypothetical protein
MKFFKAFYNSIFDFRWLSAQRGTAKNGLAYFFILIFVITLGIGSFASWQAIKFYRIIKVEFQNKIPDFQADFKGGKLKVTKLEQPYNFEYITPEKKNFDAVRFFIHIDTVSTSTVAGVERLNSFIKNKTDIVALLTGEEIIFYDGNKGGQITINNFSEVPDTSFDKEKIKGFLDKAGQYMPLVIFGIFIIAYISQAASKILFLAFWSLILLAVSKIAKKDWKYKELFSVGLFAITLPAIFSLFYFILGWYLPFAYILLYLIIMILVIFKAASKKEETPAKAISDNK